MTRAQLLKIVNKHDPMGLLSLGAPEDEYGPEITVIPLKLKEVQSKADIEKIVTEVFKNWFGEDSIKGMKDKLKKIAVAISKVV